MMRLLNPTDLSSNAKPGSLSSAAAVAAATGSTNNKSGVTNPPPLFSTPPNNRSSTVTATNKNNANTMTAGNGNGNALSTNYNKQNGVKPDDGPSAVHPQPLLDEPLFKRVHSSLIHHSSGLSVEQLEQVNSAIMTTVWKTRMEWNRVVVAKAVEMAFNEVIEDITAMQRILPSSQEQLEREKRERRRRLGSMAEGEVLGRSDGSGGDNVNSVSVGGSRSYQLQSGKVGVGVGVGGSSSVAAAGTESGIGGNVVGPPVGGMGLGV